MIEVNSFESFQEMLVTNPEMQGGGTSNGGSRFRFRLLCSLGAILPA
jgi:hypothetical protein